jgi:radical SAM protein with 4Fe4S-binding SPASM domain
MNTAASRTIVDGYGPPILGRASDRFGRLKNRFITRFQRRLLDLFDALPDPLARLYARSARRFVGGYLYSLKVELNDCCTLSCRMCYVRKDGHELTLATMRRLIGRLRGMGVRLELLGGEPLLHPDVVEIVAAAKKAGIPFVSLYTNGLAATPELSRRLHDAGLDAAIVSLISPRPEAHDEFTGRPGSWERTTAGIRSLVAAGVRTYTFTAIHRDNVADYEAVHRFAKDDLHAHALYYQYIPQRPDDPLRIEPVVWQRAKHWVLAERNPGHSEFVRKFFMLTGNACSGGNFVLTVKADGRVQPCPFISDLPLGSIHDRDIWSIYRNRYRGTDLFRLKSLPVECRPCSHRSVCAGGCRAGNKMIMGGYEARDTRCLGPWSEPIVKGRVLDRLPCFF